MYNKYLSSMEAGFGLLEDHEKRKEGMESEELEKEDRLI